MVYTGAGVTSYGFPLDDFRFTYLISGVASDDASLAGAAGLVVSWDISAASTVKLAADGDLLCGFVYGTVENRAALGIKTAPIARKFKERVPTVAASGLAVGDTVVGGGNGLVKKNTTGAASTTRVVEVFTDNTVSIEHF